MPTLSAPQCMPTDLMVAPTALPTLPCTPMHADPLLPLHPAPIAALVVLVDLSCQFAHTRREKELLRRAHTKQFAL